MVNSKIIIRLLWTSLLVFFRGPRPGMHTVLRTGAWARLPPSMMDKERRNAAFDLTDAGEILETEKDIKENIKTISGENA